MSQELALGISKDSRSLSRYTESNGARLNPFCDRLRGNRMMRVGGSLALQTYMEPDPCRLDGAD